MQMLIILIPTWYLADNTTPKGQKNIVSPPSDEAGDSDQTLGYIVSSDKDSDKYHLSDDKPLSKYVVKHSRSPEFNNVVPTTPGNDSECSAEKKRGRPRGQAKPKTEQYMLEFKIMQRHVRCDRVDEECACQGIVYKKWEPLHPDQDSHTSVMDATDTTIIPEDQEIPSWCILCPQNKHLQTHNFTYKHYLRVHHRKLLIVNASKMLSCKCLEMCSHGSDHSACNLHFHCYICYNPFKSSDLLATHLITCHTKINL